MTFKHSTRGHSQKILRFLNSPP